MNTILTKRFIVTVALIALITTLATTASIAFLIRAYPQSATRILGLDDTSGNDVATRSEPSSDTDVIDAVKKANPAVVAITISKNIPIYEEYQETIPSPFGDFFGDLFNMTVPRYRQNGTQKKDVGGGSGFLVSADGYIITNKHVVEDEDADYTVLLNDGTHYTGTVVARDPLLDLAVMRIDGTALPFLTFGDSGTLEVGQSVIAIGNALAEFHNTVSVGIVSALARSIVASDRSGHSEALNQLIQTDAAINQGNSGGPLLNLFGEVIGVNVAIASGAENIGFALSGNSAKSAIESVQRHGRIIRPYLGVRYTAVTKEIAKKNSLSIEYGVLVQRGSGRGEPAIMPGSPADKAGIVENDIILEFDGIRLSDDKSLATLIQTKNVDDTVPLKIQRAGEEKTITVTLAEMK